MTTLKPLPAPGTDGAEEVNSIANSRSRRRKFLAIQNFSMTRTGVHSTRLRNSEVRVCPTRPPSPRYSGERGWG